MAYDAGGMYYTVEARTQGLIDGARQTKRSTRSIQGDFERTDRAAQRLSHNLSKVAKAIVGVFAVRQIQRFVLSTAEAIDEQAKFAQAVNVSFGSLQRLQYAAEQNGAATNEFNNSLRRLARRTEEAARGTGAAVQAFDNLGLKAEELQNLSPDEIFLRVSDAFRDNVDASKEVSTAFGLFDTEGAKLINTLRQGSAGISELGDEAERSGRILSDEAAANAAKFNDELNKMKGAVRGAVVGVGGDLLPAITSVIESFTDFIADGENVDKILAAIQATAAATSVVIAGRFIASLAAAVTSMKAAIVTGRTLTGVMAALGGPVGILAAVAVGMITLSQSNRDNKQSTDDLKLSVEQLAEEYKGLSEARIADEIRAEKLELAALERAKEQIQLERDLAREKQANATRGRSGLAPGLGTQVSGQQEESAANRELDLINAEIEEREKRLGILTGSIKVNTDANNENTQSVIANRNATEESEKVLTDLASRNEELRAEIQGTTEAMEIRRAIQLAGVEADSAEAEVIAELVAKNREYAEAIRARTEAERQAEEAKQGFGDLQQTLSIATSENPEIARLEEQYAERLRIIEEYRAIKDADQAAADQAELEAFEALEREKAEIQEREQQARKQIQLQQVDAVASSLGDMASLMQQGGKKQFEIYKKMAIAQAVISTYSSAVKAYDAMASIPYVGPALGIAAAAAAVGFGMQQVSAIRGQSYGGGRLYGGPVQPGTMYPVTEDGRPEMLVQNGRQYLLPGARGEVISNRDMSRTSSQSVNTMNLTINAGDAGGFTERVRNAIFDLENDIYEINQSAMDARGEQR